MSFEHYETYDGIEPRFIKYAVKSHVHLENDDLYLDFYNDIVDIKNNEKLGEIFKEYNAVPRHRFGNNRFIDVANNIINMAEEINNNGEI
jgi:hypothetical protein